MLRMRTAGSHAHRARSFSWPGLNPALLFHRVWHPHKGMAVLQTAVLKAQPASPGLQLTVVDYKLQAGDASMTWGKPPCKWFAVPMNQMAEFYANQDVLIAPSIWPESYGLVTREALTAGLWVVASAIGALADSIRPGENGHLIPPGDAAALSAVLEQLSKHHPTAQPLLAFQSDRGSLDQDLVDRYNALLLKSS